VTFEFYTPYIIGAAPAKDGPWDIYEVGCKKGLVLNGTAKCQVSLSVDQGRTWSEPTLFEDGLDLTDLTKGHRQYLIRFAAGAGALRESNLRITTICQANPAVFPRLKENGTLVTYGDGQRAVVSAGPNREQARTHVIAGDFNKPTLTLSLATPRAEPVVGIYAAAHVASGNPPDPSIRYQIEYSRDEGKTWQPIVKDWITPRMGEEPPDFWSQSLCYGSIELTEAITGPVQVRFRNSGGRSILRAEAHLVYKPAAQDGTKVTFAWSDNTGDREATNTFAPNSKQPATWQVPTGNAVKTRWIEFAPVVQR
jgi:hypothetical protein